ncbi:hypothetical protein DE146DRAFT_678636 [Phaeosphaeria sp. MPI-PUGE-AT-0046c]|nr:hypothetical protein DE146DRAFT_678636 [Phaeosphaeria sp. MPI-PUGE-AT-0046c]
MEFMKSRRIIEALHKFIQEERLRNFCFLASSSHRYMNQEELLIVSSATNEAIQEAMTGHHDSKVSSDHDWFTFRQMAGNDSAVHTVMITTAPRADVSIDEMTIMEPHSKGSLTNAPAVTWMLEKYNLDDEGAMKFSKEQYDEQFLWWRNIKKSFRLFDLPAELRDAIYLQIIGPVILPDLYGSEIVFGRGLSYGRAVSSQRFRDPEIEAPNMSIMRLEMSAAACFESIGIKPTFQDPLARATANFSLSHLRHFTELREVDFRFIGPKHPDAICPWALISNTHKEGEHSCQKQWIDWFFVLGWNALEQLRQKDKIRYTLSGCVKTSTKRYWEHALNNKDSGRASTIRAARTRIRQEKTNNSPIDCKCSTPCSKAEAGKYKAYTWTEREIERIGGLQEHIDDIYWSFKD